MGGGRLAFTDYASLSRPLPEHVTHLVGEEPVPLVLLRGRAVHPLEDRVPDEDGQCSQDEGRKQVQVDVVPGTVQVSVGESKAPSWQDGQRVCSTSLSSQADGPLRHVSASGTVSFLPLKMPFFLATPQIPWVQCVSPFRYVVTDTVRPHYPSLYGIGFSAESCVSQVIYV